MSISTYNDLKTSIAAYLQRSDLTAIIPDFITLAESDINADIADLQVAQSHISITTAANNPLVSTASMYALRDAWCNGEPLHIGLPSSLSVTDTRKGAPEAVVISGASSVRIYPIPDAAYTIDLLHIPLLSIATELNWVFTQSPSAYLYGSLLHASAYIEDMSKISAWQAGYEAAISRLRSANRHGHATMTAPTLIGLTRESWSDI